MSTYGERKVDVLRVIHEFTEQHGVAPTGDELAGRLDISRAYAYLLLERMEEEGLLVRPRLGKALRVGRATKLSKVAMKTIEESM